MGGEFCAEGVLIKNSHTYRRFCGIIYEPCYDDIVRSAAFCLVSLSCSFIDDDKSKFAGMNDRALSRKIVQSMKCRGCNNLYIFLFKKDTKKD